MSDALRSLSYEGTLVYLHDSKLETLRIVHRVENGQVHEKLVSLNGPERTLTREKGQVTCELSNSNPISVPGHEFDRDMLRARSINPNDLEEHYSVRALGSARVAGRLTDVVEIAPRDGLRYGYRFYLDQESGLPLKSDLMGRDQAPIEQIMFTSLELETSTQQSPVVAGRSSEPASAPGSPNSPMRIPDELLWRFAELPAGYALVMHDDWRDGAGEPVLHFVLSDGLASISVYVENDPAEGLDGATHIGAVHAAGDRVSGYQITVVGEVPSATVQAVLAGVRHGGDGQP